MNNKAKIIAAKYAAYALLMILLYVLQTTPRFLEIFGIKPNFVIPAAICVAMLEGEFIGGLYGALAGVFCDLGGYMIFGFNAIIVMVACVCAGLLVIYLLRPSMINFVLLLTGAMLARGLLEYLLGFVMWGYENVWMVLSYHILPTILYTAAASPLVFYLVRRVGRVFDELLAD